MPKRAAIDTDFLNHLAGIRDIDDVYALIVRFFCAMDVKVIMHPLVYKHEKSPTSNPIIDKLFTEGIITVPTMQDILEAKPGGRLMYEGMVTQVYGDYTGKKYPLSDVCSGWQKGCSLGEVHSVVMCVFLDCEYLFSDDMDAVRHLCKIMKMQTQTSVDVLNRKMCGEKIKGSDIITGKERRLLSYERT